MKCVGKRLILYSIVILKLLESVSGQTCGQTPCKEPGYCCTEDSSSTTKDCCCTQQGGSFSSNCIHSSGVSIPWWAILLIVVALVAIGGGVGFYLYRRKYRRMA